MTAKQTTTIDAALLTQTFTLSRDSLVKALTWVVKAISGRSSLPILSYVHIAAGEGRCTLTCCDLAQWHQERIPAIAPLGQGEVTLCLSARQLLSLAQTLPVKAEVSFSREDGSRWRLRCGSVNTLLPSLPAEEFPMGDWEEAETASRFFLPAKGLAQAIASVLPFVAKDETRPVLTAIRMASEDGRLVLAGTDTHRLALCASGIPIEAVGAEPDILIPARGAQVLLGLAESQGEGEVALSLSHKGNLLKAEAGENTLTLRLMEGQFPNYERLIPTDLDKSMTVEVAGFMAALKRAHLVAADNANRVVLDCGDPKLQQVVVSASSQFGEHEETVEAGYSGGAIAAAFNGLYLQDAARVVSEVWQAEGLVFALREPLRPGVIRPVGSEGQWLCVMMPMQVV